MKKVKTYRLGYDDYITYEVPSKQVALEYSKETQGEQYDKIEERLVRGGLPLVWRKL